MKSFEIVITFRYKGRIMKLFNIRKVMVLVSFPIHEARISRTFFSGLKASRRWKLKKLIMLENIKSNELRVVFSKIVSEGLCCDKVWRISIFSSCTPIRGMYRKTLLSKHVMKKKKKGLYSSPKNIVRQWILRLTCSATDGCYNLGQNCWENCILEGHFF